MVALLRKLKRFYYGTIGNLWSVIRTQMLLKLWHINAGKGTLFDGPTMIRVYAKGGLSIGENTKFVSNRRKNSVGLTGPTAICVSRGGRVLIGDNCGFSAVVINSRKSVVIGNYVKVGGNVRIFDHDFHPIEAEQRRVENAEFVRSKEIVIEDDVFIGTNAIILKGTHIGARSVIAAGSVVFGLDIPPDSMVKGNPAVVVLRRK